MQDRFEAVEFGACEIRMCVDDQAGDDLAGAGRPDQTLLGVRGETFIRDDLLGAVGQRGGGRAGHAGEGDVVGVSGIGRSEPLGQAVQPPIQPERHQVRQHRRGRRALRQMRYGQPGAEPAIGGVGAREQRLAFRPRRPGRGESRETVATGSE